MRFWQSHNKSRKRKDAQSKSEDSKFDCERFVKLSEVERKNLIQIKTFRQFDWWIQKQIHKNGACFGQDAFESENLETSKREETIKTM